MINSLIKGKKCLFCSLWVCKAIFLSYSRFEYLSFVDFLSAELL